MTGWKLNGLIEFGCGMIRSVEDGLVALCRFDCLWVWDD